MAEKEIKTTYRIKDRIKRFAFGTVLAAGLMFPSYSQETIGTSSTTVDNLSSYTSSQDTNMNEDIFFNISSLDFDESHHNHLLFSHISDLKWKYYINDKEIEDLTSQIKEAVYHCKYKRLPELMEKVEERIGKEKNERIIEALKVLQMRTFVFRLKNDIYKKKDELTPELEKKDRLIRHMDWIRSVLTISEVVKPAMEYNVSFSYRKWYYEFYFRMLYRAISDLLYNVGLTNYAVSNVRELSTPCFLRDNVFRDFADEKSFIIIANEAKEHLARIEGTLLNSIQKEGNDAKKINKVHHGIQKEFIKNLPYSKVSDFLKYNKDLSDDEWNKLWGHKSMKLDEGVRFISDLIRKLIDKRIEISTAMLPFYQKYIDKAAEVCKGQPLLKELQQQWDKEREHLEELADKLLKGESVEFKDDEEAEKVMRIAEEKMKRQKFFGR
ncbi:MAG: hypothetical protein QW783_02505 [Candidatus Micrarchaeia archaeon]